jgi:DNA-binding transcriptional MerR regulator
MATLDGRRYGIAEVSGMTEVPVHVLRQWEARFPQLRPKRDRANHRQYSDDDIAIVRRIKQLLWIEKMTTEGARKRLAQELRGEGRPKTRQEALELLDKIESEVREMLGLLDRYN